MKKIKLKKNKKINFLIIIIILIIISVTFLFNIIGKKVTPIIINYAEKQSKKIALKVITEAVDNNVLNEINDDLFIETEKGIDYNTVVINKLLETISKNVRNYLKKLENGEIELDNNYTNVSQEKLKNGVIYEIPSGIIFNNGLLSNLGPKVPVKISLIGDIVTDIVTDIKEYGINNALIQIGIKVKVNEQVILPFATNEISIETNIPLIIKMVKGEVPSYYLNPYSLSSQKNE